MYLLHKQAFCVYQLIFDNNVPFFLKFRVQTEWEKMGTTIELLIELCLI